MGWRTGCQVEMTPQLLPLGASQRSRAALDRAQQPWEGDMLHLSAPRRPGGKLSDELLHLRGCRGLGLTVSHSAAPDLLQGSAVPGQWQGRSIAGHRGEMASPPGTCATQVASACLSIVWIPTHPSTGRDRELWSGSCCRSSLRLGR